MEEQPIITISDAAFPRRFANLLVDTRRRRDLSIGDIVRLGDQRLSRAQVKSIEEGALPLTEELVETACQIYGADLAVILPERLPVVVDAGILTTGGVVRDFDPADPDSLLTAYLSMVRELRNQEKAPVVDLRRSDLDVLADYLQQPGEHVLDRLMTLMGATRARRISVAVLFASGAAVIGLVGGAAALSLGGSTGDDGDGGSVPADTSTALVVTTQPVESSTAVTVQTVAPTTNVATSAPTSTVATTVPVSATTSPPATATTVAPVAPPTTTLVAVAPPPLPPTAPPTTDPGEPLPTVVATTTIVDVGQPPVPTTSPGEPLPPGTTTPVESETGLPPLPPSVP